MSFGIEDASRVASHYREIDPYQPVAEAKMPFFDAALDYMARIGGERRGYILDVGCGYGYFLKHAIDRGWRTAGVELVSEAARAAEALASGVNVFNGTFHQAEFKTRQFDAITLWDVLFMVENPRADVEKCYRLLKPGGLIGIRLRNVVFQWSLFQMWHLLESIAARCGVKRPYVFHHHNFSAEAIRLLLSRAGFVQVEVTNSPLTAGDPYRYAGRGKVVAAVKKAIYAVSVMVEKRSRGLRIIGPSLLVWARKPMA